MISTKKGPQNKFRRWDRFDESDFTSAIYNLISAFYNVTSAFYNFTSAFYNVTSEFYNSTGHLQLPLNVIAFCTF